MRGGFSEPRRRGSPGRLAGSTRSTTTLLTPIGGDQCPNAAASRFAAERDHGLRRVVIRTRESAIHGTQHATLATTTSPTQIGGELQCPLGNLQRLWAHGSNARVASCARQSAIHRSQHATRATTSPSLIDAEMQRPLA